MVRAIQINATRKTISAALSSFSDRLSFFVRMDRKDSRQLITSRMAPMPVMSSMIVALPDLDTLMEVNTIKQNPSRLEEVLSMCGDFSVPILLGSGV